MTDTTVETTEDTVEPEAVDTETTDTETEEEQEPETFPLAYVQKLRQEAAESRVKAKRADDLAQRLHASLVASTGRLADPSDLAFDDSHIDDPDALSGALDELLTRKPHLASRRPSGHIGQGATPVTDSVDLAGLLRARA